MRNARRSGELTKEEVLELKVQTQSPWARALFAIVGISGTGIGAACQLTDGPWWITSVFGFAGIVLICFGAFGRKELLERELKKVTPGRVADTVLSSILDRLT